MKIKVLFILIFISLTAGLSSFSEASMGTLRSRDLSRTEKTHGGGGSDSRRTSVLDSLYLNYRGERKSFPREKLNISNFTYEFIDNELVNIEIKFNQSINPLSISNSCIKMNEYPVCEKSTINFNKKADIVTIKMPVQYFNVIIEDSKEKIRVEIAEIQTFDGNAVQDGVSCTFSLNENAIINQRQ